MPRYLYHTLQIVVKVPYAIKAETVENEINAALDEPPADWGSWTVGAAVVVRSTTREP